MHTAVKSEPLTLRASAVLPAAGAFDPISSAVAASLGDYSEAEIRVTYTRGAAGGKCAMTVWVSDREAGTYGARSIDDGTIDTADNVTSYSQVYVSAKVFPEPLDNAPLTVTYLVRVDTARYMKVLFSEVGIPGTPGTVSADCVLGGQQLA